MELQHFSHQHPLLFIVERGNENEKVYCSGCGEMVSAPTFNCVACGFHLHKQCAEAPSELIHPFHRNHSFSLLQSKPNNYKGECVCDFCAKKCENFVYHCSCNLYLHIKCALFSYNIAQKGIAEFRHIARIDPLISTENRPEKLKNAQCFACWKPLLDSVYFSPDCGFYLHVKCAELPSEIKQLFRHPHPLILQFSNQHLSCHICQKPQHRGFVYSCSSLCEFVLHTECATKIDHSFHRKHPLILQLKDEGLPCRICHETKPNQIFYSCSICKFALHIECASQPPIIEDESHPHPFTLFWRHISFICDACGTSGNHVSYICSICCLTVHKKCISLPGTLRHPMHYKHPISHTYFLGQYEMESWECRICHVEDVNSKHGGYCCSVCNYVAHVNCAIEDYNWYETDEFGRVDGSLEDDSALIPYFIVKENKEGENVEATEIKHFSHEHNLVLSKDIDMSDEKYCDGCVLSIFTCYYGCSECGFFLHKSCAELPRKIHIWSDRHPKLHPLTVDSIFQCRYCKYESNGFAYTCNLCDYHYCLRCALVSDNPIHEGHEHHLPCHPYKAMCNACGGSLRWPFRCKACNFALHRSCLTLPLTARHKSDEHPYKLTYHDNKNYPESNYCDICEEERNPNLWFYHCAICDNSAHPICALGKYSFFKLGSIYTKGDHPHPLIFVHMVHHHPECHRCGHRCLDLALECRTTGCSYIVHWECIKQI